MNLPAFALYVLPVFGVLIAVEALWYWHARRDYPWRDSLASLGVWVGRILAGIAGTAFILLVYTAVWEVTPLRIPLDNVWSWVLLFAGLEFFYYWFHRCSHEIRWMWATHTVHHTAERIHLVAAYRLGWTSTISGSWLFYLPLVMAGFHPGAVLLMLGINLTYQFWLHTEAIGKLPHWFEYVFNTPSHHRVHHAVNPAYLDRNYGGVVIVFDRLFGSFAEERADDPCKYGLVDPNSSRNPFVIALREWFRIGRDLVRAKGWRQRFLHAFGPPGWKPEGGLTTKDVRRAAGLAA